MKAAMTVVQRLMEDIADQGYKPGDVLPGERDMLVQYEVGRGTLREALRFLELQGILNMKSGPGGGPIVAEPDSRHLANSFGLLLQISDVKFESVVEARLRIEPQLAALAAERADESVIAELRESVSAMRANRDDGDVFLAENQRFHQLIATASGNPVFAYLIESVHWLIDGSSQGVQYPERFRGVVARAHKQVLEAIEAHDAEGAQRAMRDHIENMMIYVRKHYPSSLERPIRWRMVQG